MVYQQALFSPSPTFERSERIHHHTGKTLGQGKFVGKHQFKCIRKDKRQPCISRFIESLDAKIAARYRSKLKQDTRTYPCHLRDAWVREVGEINQKSHYHMMLFVNNDTFNGLGSYKEDGTGLASLIREAWLSALQFSHRSEHWTLARFPDNPLYYLDANSAGFKDIYDQLTLRLSYFAKERTKDYSREERSFGCSQS